jgi:hypothetical protein
MTSFELVFVFANGSLKGRAKMKVEKLTFIKS